MISFARFSKLIAEKWASASPARLSAISKLDPRRFYVENVRAALGTPTWMARLVCETAVRQGVLVKGIQVLCPDGSVTASAVSEAQLPPHVRCWEDIDGDLTPVEIETATLSKLEFYAVPGDARESHA